MPRYENNRHRSTEHLGSHIVIHTLHYLKLFHCALYGDDVRTPVFGGLRTTKAIVVKSAPLLVPC